MAITLNKHAARCEQSALASGQITPLSSPRTSLYEISRCWRTLLDATGYQGNMPGWSEKEEAAAEVMVATLTYLRRIGCRNIEQLLKDCVNRHALLGE